MSVHFLMELYKYAAGGYITVSVKQRGSNQLLTAYTIPSDTLRVLEILRRAQRVNHEGASVYIGIATRQRNLGPHKRGGYRDIQALPAYFVDIDQPLEQALASVQTYPLAPSALVASGYGLHAYWWLQRPTEDIGRSGQVLTTLATHLNGDPQVNPASAMRLPGTINHKPGRNRARLLRITRTRYQPEDFGVMAREPPVHGLTSGNQSIPRYTGDAFNPDLIEHVSAVLISNGGRMKSNGWIECLCPATHKHDRPGLHFNFNPNMGLGVCHGKHGRLLLKDICDHLNINPRDYGGIYQGEVYT